MPRFSAPIVLCALSAILLPSVAFAAKGNADRFQINHDIRIQPEDEVAEVNCINCSVYVRGRVSGDVTTINGNVVADLGAAIAGDFIVVRGVVCSDNGSQVAGVLTAIG